MRETTPYALRTRLPSSDVWGPAVSKTLSSPRASKLIPVLSETLTTTSPSTILTLKATPSGALDSETIPITTNYTQPKLDSPITKLTIKIPERQSQLDPHLASCTLDSTQMYSFPSATLSSATTHPACDDTTADMEISLDDAFPLYSTSSPCVSKFASTLPIGMGRPTAPMTPTLAQHGISLDTQWSTKVLLSRLQRRYSVPDLRYGGLVTTGISTSLDPTISGNFSCSSIPRGVADTPESKASIAASESILKLKYFYLFLDYAVQESEDETPRHQLAQYTGVDDPSKLPELDICLMPFIRFPMLKSTYDRSSCTASFYLMRVGLDMSLLNLGEFKNILLFEAKTYMTVECTTSVYSFGKRILETIEPQVPQSSSSDGFFYQFDYVRQFFTAFLNGFQFLDGVDEAQMAIENLSIMQMFEAIDFDSTRRTIACVMYEFQCGSGYVEMLRLVEGGITE
ncbi:hypothetical protein BASA61_005054 [Batrachochytrium salamandrivorans]|nr:hypothetical protein BASA62_003559 [Batrachochytrium salamandrivorans]KAH6591154.1 hypothetical protein BASA61_005054 [Batrachochytrium salamandrivorans]KAH9248148.1 hypothetical protein BASA81_014222 [Batrachochytrium salamandrivorans]